MTWILVVFLIGLALALGLMLGLIIQAKDEDVGAILFLGIFICAIAFFIFFAGAYHGRLDGWQLFDMFELPKEVPVGP